MTLTRAAYALDGFACMRWRHSGQAYGARDGSNFYWTSGERRCRQSGIVALLFSTVYAAAGEHIIRVTDSLPQIQLLADRFILSGGWYYRAGGRMVLSARWYVYWRDARRRNTCNSMAVAAREDSR